MQGKRQCLSLPRIVFEGGKDRLFLVPVLPNEELAIAIVYEMHILAAPHSTSNKKHILYSAAFGDGRISWFEAWEIVLHNNEVPP